MKRATVVACTSVTLAACYGAVGDGAHPWDSDHEPGRDLDGLGGDLGEGGAASCVTSELVDIGELPRVELFLAPTSAFDREACSLGAGFGTGLFFRASEQGVYRLSIEASFPVSLSAFSLTDDRCDDYVNCVMARPEGGAGGAAAGGDAGGNPPLGSATLELRLESDEAVALLVSGDAETEGSAPRAALHIEWP